MSRISYSVSVVLLALAAAGPAGAQDRPLPLAVAPPATPPAGEGSAYVPGRVLVKFRFDIEPGVIDEALRPLGGSWAGSGEGRAFEILSVPQDAVEDWAGWLSSLPSVEYAEPDYIARAADTPNDPFFFPYQWNFYDYGVPSNGYPSQHGVQGMTAWDTSLGAGVIVAIVDTGVAYENYGSFCQAPDLAGATFVAPRNFVNGTTHGNDDNGHGTHVCGTVRQTTGNGIGCAGMARDAVIMPVKVLDSAGNGTYSNISNGIRHAADNGAAVINLSLGGTVGSSTLESAVNYAWSLGCVLVAATGNDSRNRLRYPARYTNCIAVGATRFDGKRPTYSNYGSGIDVVAPGGDVLRDQNGDGYGDGILQQTFQGNPCSFSYWFFDGTSMATPHVAGLAALIRANRPGYTNAQVRAAIEGTCKDLGKAGYDTTYGYGLINAAAAVQN